MNNRGTEKMTAVYWFAILLIVASAIAYMVFVFYGKPYSVKQVELEILTNQIANCLAEGGYLKEDIVAGLNGENILERCNLNFDVEDVADWKENGQYYVELEIYEFDENLPEGDVGAQIIPKVVYGNPSLKSFSSIPKESDLNNKTIIVIHYTAGGDSYKDIESVLKNRDLSVQYILQRDGKVAECEIDVWKLKECTLKDVSEVIGTWEKTSAQHAGCGVGETALPECPSECLTEFGKLTEDCHCGPRCCIKGFNQRGIGIEVMNVGIACRNLDWCKNTDKGIQIEDYCWNYEDSIWEVYPDEQMNALIELVAGIAERNNIPVDREHILGHEEITNDKNDPGPAFDWERLIEGVKEKTGRGISKEELTSKTLDLSSGRNFYAIDKNNNKYIIKILGVVGKDEKNEE